MTSNTAVEKFDPTLWVWGTDNSKPRFLHTMLRVTDIDVSMNFYIDVLGMKKLDEKFDVPSRRVTAIFIGFESYEAGGCLELVNAWDAPPHTEGFGAAGHISIGVPDIHAVVKKVEAAGLKFSLQPTVLLEGGPHVAFFKDPDGYLVELLQTKRN